MDSLSRREGWSRLQRRIAETPFEFPIAGALALNGFAGIVSGQGIVPRTIDLSLPLWLIQMWTIALTLGGVLTVLGRLTPYDRLESAGLALLGYGATLYALVLLFTGGFPATLLSAFTFLAVTAGCGVRMRVLATSRKARRVATDLTRGWGLR